MAKRHERTQTRNPHQLTIRQHCFPRKSIERFANKDGLVHVHLIKHNKTVFLKPEDNNFCALRTWDQRAEIGYMREIEDEYQDLATKIADGTIVRRLSLEEKNIVTDMYVLWNCRWHWNNNPAENQTIKGALGVSREFSIDEQEHLEKEGISVIRPDLSISGRHLTGVKIQQNFLQQRKHMRGCTWGILNSPRTGFVVPDNASNSVILPVTPNKCLVNAEGYHFANEREVAEMNNLARKYSEKYYFARSL